MVWLTESVGLLPVSVAACESRSGSNIIELLATVLTSRSERILNALHWVDQLVSVGCRWGFRLQWNYNGVNLGMYHFRFARFERTM